MLRRRAQARHRSDDSYSLSVLSYYQYLAMDHAAAENTRQVHRPASEPAGYNNKGLIYKRRASTSWRKRTIGSRWISMRMTSRR